MAWERAYSGEMVKNTPREIREVIVKARAFAPEAVETLVELMRNPRVSTKVRLDAANSILDRACGRAPQLNFNVDLDSEREQTREQVIAIAREAFLAMERGDVIDIEVVNDEPDSSPAGNPVPEE